MRSLEFWNEVERRRNHFFLVWAGWLVAGPILLWLFYSILPVQVDAVVPYLALGIWGSFWLYITHRLTSMKCYSCGNKAFAHPLFFMRDAKCLTCGIKRSDIEPSVLPPNTSLERMRDR
jgi:hypothetical protein